MFLNFQKILRTTSKVKTETVSEKFKQLVKLFNTYFMMVILTTFKKFI